MKYTDILMNDFTDHAFRSAFRTYFDELGCRVTNWDGLFAGMNDKHREYTWSHRDENGRLTSFAAWMNEEDGDFAFVRKDETGEVTGFVQFTTVDMSCWFFRAKCGFIREFWIRADLRRQGHGSELLRLAEKWLRQQGCLCILLTTSTAPEFYCKHGYDLQKSICARNQEPVYLKHL